MITWIGVINPYLCSIKNYKMNKMKSLFAVAVLAVVTITSCNSQSMEKVKLETEVDSFSYSLGVNVGQNIKQQGVNEVNALAFSKAIADVFAEGDLEISEADAGKIINDYFKAIHDKKFAEAKEEGEKFLAENAKRDGVTTLESGLQYEVINSGNGASPTLNDNVKTHYHGTLINGEVFDSSVDRGEPISFPVSGVIAGWTEALQLMKVGDKWKLYVPSNLAYGERGAGPKIGPHTTLIFEVELLGINE